MKNKSYFEEREKTCIKRADEIVGQLPYFVNDYIIGIEPKTSPLTRLNYCYDLRVFFDFLCKKVFKNKKIEEITLDDINEITASDIEYFLNYLNLYEINGKTERCTETGKARKLCSVRSFFKYLFNKGKIVSNNAAKVATPKIHEKEIIRLDSNEKVDEIGDMIYVVESGHGLSKHQKDFHDNTKIRDTAIVTLFLGTGIRISELVGLNISDFNFDDNSFVVTRKGGNRMILYYSADVKEPILKYLEERKEKEKENYDESAPLFLSLQNKRINVRTVENLVKKYAKIVTPLKKITPHKLRSTFGTNLYNSTKDIYVVAEVLGHKDINTTKKHYAAQSENVRRNALSNVKLKND